MENYIPFGLKANGIIECIERKLKSYSDKSIFTNVVVPAFSKKCEKDLEKFYDYMLKIRKCIAKGSSLETAVYSALGVKTSKNSRGRLEFVRYDNVKEFSIDDDIEEEGNCDNRIKAIENSSFPLLY